MVGIDPFMQKRLMDFTFGGAAASAPAARWVGWATQSPTSQSDFAGPWTRVTFSPAAASTQGSPAATVSNRAAMTSRATAIGTAVGWNIYDASSGGNRLFYGTVTASLGCASSADLAAFPVGGLRLVLS